MSNQKPTKIKDKLFLRLINEITVKVENELIEGTVLNQDNTEQIESDNVNDIILLFMDLKNVIKTKKISPIEAINIYRFVVMIICECKRKHKDDDTFLKLTYIRAWIEKSFEITCNGLPCITWFEES